MSIRYSLLSSFVGAVLLATPFCLGQVVAINPTCGPTAGGTPISITGANFVGVTSVTIGGAPVVNVVVVNAALITGQTPGGLPGPKNVTVCNAQGCSTLTGGFSHLPMNTTTLVTNGGFEQSMTGWIVSGGGVDQVDWQPPEGVHAIDLNGGSPGTIQQAIPTAAGRNYILAFWLAGNCDGGPTIKTLQVSAGSTSAPFSFDTTGLSSSNMGWKCKSMLFTASGPATNVQFASTTVSSPFGPALDGVAVYELTTLTAPSISPIGTPINYSLLMSPSTPYVMDVSTTGSVPGTVVNGVLIPLNPPFLNYDFGIALPGVFVNFLGVSNALGVATAAVNVPNAPVLIGTQLSAVFVTLDVVSPSGLGAVAEPIVTTIVGPAPIITSVLPPTGPSPGGTTLTISGANFSPGATVKIDGVTAANPAVTPTFIVCVTPPGALGPADVRVENPGGLFALLPNAFTYVPLLVLNSVTPLAAAAGASVTLGGSGIQPGATVAVGGLAAQVITQSPSSLSFALPSSVPCDTSILLTNPDGQTASIAFNPTPVVSGVVNGSGPVAGGNSFALLGSQFLAGSTVTVGGASAIITFQSSTFIVCTAPPGSLGITSVVVTSPGGCAASGVYTYQ